MVFEDGTFFRGNAFTEHTECIGEVVFNTALSGYQEIISDPSYSGQIVVMTYPQIGNYGINDEDFESKGLHLEAFLMREYCDVPSNWRSTKSLKELLDQYQIPGYEGFDTRAITRYIREKGAQKALLTVTVDSFEQLQEKLAAYPNMVGRNLVQEVTTSEPYYWEAPASERFKVAVIDCGVKWNILRKLTSLGCYCHVLPASTTADFILSGDYDGVFISNGPGDPEPVTSVITLIRDLLGKKPVFGICLGHQLMGLALGGRTYKLKFGHHGGNHPVKNIKTSAVEISSQNHGFCLDSSGFPDFVELTHVNLNDNTVEGIRDKRNLAFSVQYHPESAPGPHDSGYLFQEFIEDMTSFKGGSNV